MTRAINRLLLVGGLIATTAGLASAGASAQSAAAGFVTYENDKHGFSLIYSGSQFLALPSSTPDGFQAVSKDGKGRLLAGTIANFDNKSLGAYRNFLLGRVYAGAKIDYAPVRDTWFVLSGVKADGTTAFYQRVNFVCGGRNINSWAVLFPAAEEATYSRIIEQVHRDYVLGDGNCARAAAMAPTVMPPKQMATAMAPVMPPKEMAAMDGAMPPKQMTATAPLVEPKQTAAMDPAMPPKMAAVSAPAQARPMGPMSSPMGAMRAGLATYSSDKHGFALRYPADRFLALPPATPDLFQAVSRDGKAILRAGTLANFDAKTLGAYRTFLLAAAYPGAKLDDAPARDNGFVLSGTTGDGNTAFYHQVSFVCGGSSINSWVLTFPAGDRSVYGPIVDQVRSDYRLGDGKCDTTAMMRPTTAR